MNTLIRNPFADTDTDVGSSEGTSPFGAVGTGLTSFMDNLTAGLTFDIMNRDNLDPEEKENHPTATKIGEVGGQMVGTLGSLYLTSQTLGMFPTVAGLMKAPQLATTVGKVVKGRALADGLLFGTHELTKEIVSQVKEKDFDPMELGKAFSFGSASGAVFGATGGLGDTRSRTTDALIGGLTLATANASARILNGEQVRGDEILTDALVGGVYNAVLHRSVNTEANRKVAEANGLKAREVFSRLLSDKAFTEEQIAETYLGAVGLKKREAVKDLVAIIKPLREGDPIFEALRTAREDGSGGFVTTVRKLSADKAKKIGKALEASGADPEKIRVEGTNLIEVKKTDKLQTIGSGKSTKVKLEDGTEFTIPGNEKAKELNKILGSKIFKLSETGEKRVTKYGMLELTPNEKKNLLVEVFGALHDKKKLDKLKIADLTDDEAEYLLGGVRKYLEDWKGVTNGIEGIPLKPREGVQAPGMLSLLTPAETYATVLRVDDVMAPIFNAKNIVDDTMYNVGQYTKYLMGEWKRLAGGTSASEKIQGVVFNKASKAQQEVFDFLTGVKWKGLSPEAAAQAREATLKSYTPEQQHILKELRLLTESAFARTNEYREFMGLKKIEHLDDYLPQLYKAPKYGAKAGEAFQVTGESKTLGGDIFDPREMHRTVDAPNPNEIINDPAALVNALWHNELKTMYLTAPKKALDFQLKRYEHLGQGAIPQPTKEWITKTVEHVVLGRIHGIDNIINKSLDNTGLLTVLETSMNAFGRSLGSNPIRTIANAYSREWDRAFIAGRPKMPLRNYLQNFLISAFTDGKVVARAMVPDAMQPKWMKDMMQETLMYKRTMRTPMLDKEAFSAMEGIEKAAFAPYEASQIYNVKTALQSGLRQVEEYIKNPKYKSVGFRSKQRTGNEPPDFFYPEERALMLKEANSIANNSQFDYSTMAKVPLLQSATGRMLGKYLSYPIHMAGSFGREVVHRAVTGHPSWDIKGEINLPTHIRHGYVKLMAYGVAATLAARKAGIDIGSAMPWGAMPRDMGTGWQAIEGLANAYASLMDGDTANAKRNAGRALGLILPVRYGRAVKDIKDVVTGEKTVKEYLTYTVKKKKEKTPSFYQGFRPPSGPRGFGK